MKTTSYYYLVLLPLLMVTLSYDSSKSSMAMTFNGCVPENPDPEIFRVVENMPFIMGCEDIEEYSARKACANKLMLDFIYSNLKYPKVAFDQQIEGTAVVQFIVEKEGCISSIILTRDIGGGTGDEALRLVNLLEMEGLKWSPGKQRERKVRVQFNLPIKFQITSNTVVTNENQNVAFENCDPVNIAAISKESCSSENLLLYPNPASRRIRISYVADRAFVAEYQICDMFGQQISTTQ